MESCVKNFLSNKGYTVNDTALSLIKMCDDWYVGDKVKNPK